MNGQVNNTLDAQRIIVNGKPTDLKHQTCTRCCQDTTVPNISFDAEGVCNYCHFHDTMTKIFPNGEKGKKTLSVFQIYFYFDYNCYFICERDLFRELLFVFF